jgi:hypothetical protein
MSAFDYFMIFVTIIIALAIEAVAKNIDTLIAAKRRVKWHWMAPATGAEQHPLNPLAILAVLAVALASTFQQLYRGTLPDRDNAYAVPRRVGILAQTRSRRRSGSQGMVLR